MAVGEETHILQAGQAFLTYPHIVTYYAADLDTPWNYSWIAFTGEEIEHLLSKTSLSPEHPVFPMDELLMPSLYDRLTEAGDRSDCLNLPLKAMMYEFFSLLLSKVSGQGCIPDSAPKKHLRRAMSPLPACPLL